MKSLSILFATVSLWAWAGPAPLTLEKQERLITILGTNDIHGGVEAEPNKDGKLQGGLQNWAGIAKAIREGVKAKYKSQAGVLTVDAGDQFQGTLLSNYDEGELVFSAMNEVGYDAAIPGNHDYDFGPVGWEVDQSKVKSKRREAFEKIIKLAKFPLLSGNTFLTESLVNLQGKSIEVKNDSCKPVGQSHIDWSKAKTLKYLEPYRIVNVAGVRVALIGIDNPHTPGTTTFDNVEDLCFGDEVEHYVRIRESLEGQADVFVLIIHQGNAKTDKDLNPIMEKLTKPKHLVDAVISGHTHFYYNEKFDGVPAIQSGSGGASFGRIDLVWDAEKKTLVPSKTRAAAGVRIYEKECDATVGKYFSEDFCVVQGNQVKYEGVAFTPNKKVEKLIQAARAKIRPLAEQHLGHAHVEITRDRIRESPLANALTEAFRDASVDKMQELEKKQKVTRKEAQRPVVAAINTGGIRDSLKAGDITYEKLFKVIPFSNHAVMVGPMSVEKLVLLMDRSIKTCGSYGALMQSGLRVQFRRDCSHAEETDGKDPNAKLIKIETVDGKLIFDEKDGIAADAPSHLTVATLDFLSVGGSGFTEFKGETVFDDLGLLRNLLVDKFKKTPADLKGDIDGRWKNELPEEDVEQPKP